MSECPNCGRTGTHACPPPPRLSELYQDALARAEAAEVKVTALVAACVIVRERLRAIRNDWNDPREDIAEALGALAETGLMPKEETE